MAPVEFDDPFIVAVRQQRDAKKTLVPREINGVFEEPASVPLTAVIRVHDEVLEQKNKTAFGRADRDEQVDHSDNAGVVAQDEDAPAVRLFENEAQATHLFRLVRSEFGLGREQIGEEVGHERQILQSSRFDAQVGHMMKGILRSNRAARRRGSNPPEFPIQLAPGKLQHDGFPVGIAVGQLAREQLRDQCVLGPLIRGLGSVLGQTRDGTADNLVGCGPALGLATVEAFLREILDRPARVAPGKKIGHGLDFDRMAAEQIDDETRSLQRGEIFRHDFMKFRRQLEDGRHEQALRRDRARRDTALQALEEDALARASAVQKHQSFPPLEEQIALAQRTDDAEFLGGLPRFARRGHGRDGRHGLCGASLGGVAGRAQQLGLVPPRRGRGREGSRNISRDMRLHGTQPLGTRLTQARSNGFVHRIAHDGATTEADLAFGWMDIAVDLARIDFQMQNNARMASGLDHLAVGFAQTGGQRGIVHRAPVDEKKLATPIGPRRSRSRDEPGDTDAIALERRHLEQLRPVFCTEKVADSRGERVARGQTMHLAPVAQVTERDVGKTQGDNLQRTVDVCGLRCRAAQEFPPRGNIEKKRFHLDRRASGAARIAHRNEFPPAHHGLGPRIGFGSPRAQSELGNTRDARKRFAAETHCPHRGEFGRRGNLARGMALQGHERVLAIHARTIVSHAQECRPGTAHLHFNAGRTRIEAVLHQLFDDRGRTLDHFARRHLAGYHLGKNPYLTHGSVPPFDFAASGGLETLRLSTCADPTTQFHRSSRMFKELQPKRRRSSPEADGLFGWTIFIVILALFAVFCWVGSFYVFGHPEKGLSYSLLKKFGKIDAPKRFKLTSAPRGKFLTANDLHERFNPMAQGALKAESNLLLRNYLRNYGQTRDQVPYVIGEYRVMGVFRLGSENFFPTGVVALAESVENPSVLLELVFPSAAENTQDLERMLQTGLDLKLVKTLDLTAVVGARKLPDGRLSVTAVPLLYGNYTSSNANGTFSLEPPEDLNVGAGLPVLNQAAVDAADKNFRTYAQRAGLIRKETPAVLMRVQQTEAAQASAAKSDDTASAPRAVPVNEEAIPVAKAIPVTEEATPPIAKAIPVTAEDKALPAGTPSAELQTNSIAAPATVAATTAAPAKQWTLHNPGKMPRGRLVDMESARASADRARSEKTYLRGDFKVTASGPGRAVLRGTSGGRDARVIVDFPDGTAVPPEGESFSRDNQRPFEITSVEEGPDGQVNIYVREVTRP